MNNMFTDGVKRVMQTAREESARLGHNYIGTEHLLLGIIKDGKGKAVTVMTNLGLNLETVKSSIEDYVSTLGGTTTIGEVPFTPRAKQILEVAANEAITYRCLHRNNFKKPGTLRPACAWFKK